MGHTHYNEISNDGHALYTATRSTGQVEEGPVGFSATNLDGDVVSWRFVELADTMTVVITSPADARLTTIQEPAQSELTVRAKIWSDMPVAAVHAALGPSAASLTQIAGSQAWQGIMNTSDLSKGMRSLRVVAHIGRKSRRRRHSDCCWRLAFISAVCM